MAATIPLHGDEYDLELEILRQSVAEANLARQRCTSCGRTPLIGEYVFRYDGAGSGVECELCRAVSRETAEVVREQVRHAGGSLTVQRLSTPLRAA